MSTNLHTIKKHIPWNENDEKILITLMSPLSKLHKTFSSTFTIHSIEVILFWYK